MVVRDKAALRETPSLSAPEVASLSFDIVRQLGPSHVTDEFIQWVHVSTLDGITGYLNTRDVMSPLMPRAQFGKREGKWLMIALEGPDR